MKRLNIWNYFISGFFVCFVFCFCCVFVFCFLFFVFVLFLFFVCLFVLFCFVLFFVLVFGFVLFCLFVCLFVSCYSCDLTQLAIALTFDFLPKTFQSLYSVELNKLLKRKIIRSHQIMKATKKKGQGNTNRTPKVVALLKHGLLYPLCRGSRSV